MRRYGFILLALCCPVTAYATSTQLVTEQASAPGSMTNSDVIKMVQAGFSESLIIQAIQKAQGRRFDTSADALVALKGAGATDKVISVMLDPLPQPGPTERPKPGAVEPPQVARPDENPESPKPGVFQRIRSKIPGMGGGSETVSSRPSVFVHGGTAKHDTDEVPDQQLEESAKDLRGYLKDKASIVTTLDDATWEVVIVTRTTNTVPSSWMSHKTARSENTVSVVLRRRVNGEWQNVTKIAKGAQTWRYAAKRIADEVEKQISAK